MACGLFGESAAQEPHLEPPIRKLFLAQCATCHGEKGDGVGTTKLDRPARSFLDGGFSYGNTPEAVVRTITFGIPGSVMPSFASSLSEADRRALAEYVISLGPKDAIPDTKDSVLVVADRALVARGKLPPITKTAVQRPRGLLVGTPDGLTFEYRTDDVRLLGVRSGAFCDRRDWRGRGGDALEPLGTLVHLLEGGDPAAMFSETARGSIETRLRATSLRRGEAWVESELVLDRSDAPLARLEETGRFFAPRAHSDSIPAGYERVLSLRALAACSLNIAIARAAKGSPVAISRENGAPVWLVPRDDAGFDAVTAGGAPAGACSTSGSACNVRVALSKDATCEISIRVLPRALASVGDGEALKRLVEAFGR